jgi:AcrR family transcriptional regulator
MPKLKPATLTARKNHILQAALTRFASQGYHDTTVDDIAREADLSKGSIYVHFDSKKELFLSAFVWFFDEFGVFDARDAVGSSAYEKLLCVLGRSITAITSEAFLQGLQLLVEVWAKNARDSDMKKAAETLYTQFSQPLIEIIQTGSEDGEFVPVHAPTLASILLAILDGLIVQVIIDPTAVDWVSVSETLDTLIAGLLAR